MIEMAVFILRSQMCLSVCFILIKLQLVLTLVNAYLFPDLIAIAWSFHLHLVLWQFIKQQNKPKPKSVKEEEMRGKWEGRTFCLTESHRLNVCVPLKAVCWSPKSQYDGIWRWTSWEIIRFRVGPTWWDQCL